MPRASKILAAAGLFLLVVAGLWLLIAPGQLVKYPSDLDKTAVANGKLTLFLDPATSAPLAQPQTVPLTIRRRIRVVESTGSQATVFESSVEQLGTQPAATIEHQYVLDRSTLKNVDGTAAYAYAPTNVVNRSPYFSVNLPFDAGGRAYDIWKNEVDRAYRFRQTGTVERGDGVVLHVMTGSLENAAADSTYIDSLAAQGITRELTPEQVAAQLKAQGVDLGKLTPQLLPLLEPDERETVQSALGSAVPLKYFVSVKTRLLVEPTTGAIVSLDRIDQTLSATPDFSGLAPVAQILSKPELAAIPAVQAATEKLTALVDAPPARVFNLNYAQTPSSVADFVSYAESKADQIGLVKTTIPAGLAIGGAVLILIAVAIAFRRRPPTAVPAPPVTEPEAPPRVPAGV
jgi:hypothetical protein